MKVMLIYFVRRFIQQDGLDFAICKGRFCVQLNTATMEESAIQLNQSYYLRMEWELDEMKAGRVRLVEFHSHNCFEEFAVTLNKRVRVVIRGLTELNFFFFSFIIF